MTDKNKEQRLREEFAAAAKNGSGSAQFAGEPPKAKGKAPMIIIALVMVLAVVAVVIVLGMKDNNKAGNNGVTPTAAGENKGGNGPDLSTGEFLDYAKEHVTRIGDYKNFSYEPFSFELTDEYVENYYADMVKAYSEMGGCLYEEDTEHEDREIKLGDVINFDYKGYIDGEPFENGSASGVDLLVGAGTFISDLENGLVGRKPGNTCEIPATFPENYSANPSLSGKSAVFEVTINYFCKTIPLSVDNAHLFFHYESKEQFLEYLKNYLTEKPEETEEGHLKKMQSDYVQQIIDGSEFGDISSFVDDSYQKLYAMYESAAKQQNVDIETLVIGMGFEGIESFEEYYRAAAEVQAKTEMLFHVIADQEGITMSEDKYNEIALEYAKNANFSSVAAYEVEYDKQYGKGALKVYIGTVYYQSALFEKYAKEA